MPEFSRRSFLKLASQAFVAASGVLGLGALLRFLGFQPESPSPVVIDLGPASNFPPGSRTQLPEIPAVLCHRQDGFSAFSLTCTHLGCTVQSEGDGWRCPCHGSRYNDLGEVLHGPANKSLTTLRLELSDDGHLLLYSG